MADTAASSHSRSAVALITDRVPVARLDMSIAQVRQLATSKVDDFDTIYYIYIIDEQEKLVGVMSMRDVFRFPADKQVADALPDLEEVVSVHTDTDQERAALLALRHNIKAIPVVDASDKFVGVLTSDTIMRIIDSEATENILRFGGVYHTGRVDDVMSDTLLASIRHRLPWLTLGLLGGLLTAGVVGAFESVLEQHLILAAFIPLVVYMADAVGTQMQAFIIRDITITPSFRFMKYMARHAAVAVCIGIVLSVLLYGLSFLLYSEAGVSMVLSIALFFAIMSSLFTGLVVPYAFGKLKLDPANASGPVATIIQDVVSVLVYFAVAWQIL